MRINKGTVEIMPFKFECEMNQFHIENTKVKMGAKICLR